MKSTSPPRAFTLIELLIVVAIIGILAAIAVPNFLNAQVRAKIGRVRSDLYAFSVAMEAYHINFSEYPWGNYPNNQGGYTTGSLFSLTTPVAYMSSVGQVDPFGEGKWVVNGVTNEQYYVYVNYNGFWARNDSSARSYFNSRPLFKGYGMTSFGPDRLDSGGVWTPMQYKIGNIAVGNLSLYASSNGLISYGDICRYGGEAQANTAGGE